MLTLALANIRTYARRLIAVVLAVLIGTAFLAATLMVNASTTASLERSIGESYRDADLVAAVDWGNFTGDDATGILTHRDSRQAAGVPGVQSVRAYDVDSVRAATGEKTVSAGLTALPDDPWTPPALTAGELPSGNTQVLVDADSAADAGIAVGDSIELLTEASPKPVTVTVSGLAEPSMNPMTAANMQIYGLPHLLDATLTNEQLSQVTALHLKLDPGADPEAVAADVSAALADSDAGPISVQTAEAQVLAEVDQMTGGNQAITLILMVFVLVALVVTGLVVVNTFSVLLAQRIRELALLRTIGASRGQLNRSVLVEAAIVGFVSSLLGVGLATLIMTGLVAFAQTFPAAGFVTLAVPVEAVVITTVVGTLLTLAAAWWPARKATRVAPLEAMRPSDATTETQRLGRVRIVFGAVLTLLGGAVLGLGAAQGQLVVGFAGGLVSFIGLLLLAPLFVLPAIAGIGRLTGRTVPARLASLNAVRNPSRTAATATALLIGVTLVTMMMTGAQTAKATFDSRLAGEFLVDATVDGSMAGVELDADSVATVATLDGVESVVLATPAASEESGMTVFSAGADELASILNDPSLVPGTGEVTVPQYVKDDLVVPTKDGTTTLTSIISQSIAVPPFVTTETAATLGGKAPDYPAALWIKAEPGVDPAAALEMRADIAAALGVEEYSVSGGLMEKGLFTQIIDGLLMVVIGLLAVAVLIAVIGVANTLSLSVLERTRENSLLRALGLRARQLRSMLSLESVLVGVTAAVLGIVLGSVYGVLGVQSALGTMAATVVSIPWLQLVAVLAIAVLAAWLASVVPGRRAARLSPVEGLASE
ncbi:ABC transporter permease [Zhihengliuella halotolerans]|uniref:Putative ABC transport system permease protein n=1 Tax=Zhihengliuella halotolerans TaxID=370736 RepID=A0A4Q8ABQ8_9MICC|nr:FtsX-like permease family protein [Zhihengliuella halotolerans]RZU61602.1 putative ABC transport system permease protein [Zhihengliuella halotolerans]